MKNKVLKTAMVIMLITALTLSDFILVGMDLVTYALENVNNVTNNENVKFAVYFKTEEKEVSQAEYEITNYEMKLYMDISVENEGYFDGVITLEDSNFKIKQNKLSEGINKIEGNTITLNRVRAGNTAHIEVGIEPIIEQEYNVDMLSKQSILKLAGKYNDSTEKSTNIETEKKVKLTLVAPNSLETTLNTEVITNRIYKIGEEDKKLVQIELNSGVVNNTYPINSTTYEIALPKEVESLEVISKGTYATNGKADRKLEEKNDYTWDKVNNKLQVKIQNVNQNGQISWEKDVVDNIIVTLIFPKDIEIGTEEYSAKAKVELYGQQSKILEAENKYNLETQADGTIKTSIKNEEVIYKGKIHSKEEREYTSITNIEVNYANLINGSILEEKTSYRTEKEANNIAANVQYKTTTINKAEVEKILGAEGILTIKNESGEEIKKITKDTETDKNGNIVVTYAESVKTIKIEITKAIQTGIIRLNHTKVIKAEAYSKQEIDSIKYLVEESTVKHSTAEYTFEKIKTLGETTSQVGVTIEAQSISAEQNNEVPIAITLKTDNEKYELFENPTFTITMPKGVTVNSVSDGATSQLYGGISISKLEVINNQEIKVEISGTQTEYVKSNINSQIRFTANVTVEKLMPNKTDKVKMTYENKGNSYEIETENINIIASNSKIVTRLKVENYNNLGTAIERYSDSNLEATGKLPVDNTETIKVPIKYTIINNNSSAIALNPIITVTLTDKEDKQKELMSGDNLEITIDAGKMQVIERLLEIPAGLYYSEVIDIKTTSKYTYLGTEHSVENNIKLETETKEGIRDITVVDNKLQVETFAQLGNKAAVKAEDKIYNEQIVQYIIEVTNISNETISNLNVTNAQNNGNIYDLKEVEVINFATEIKKSIEHEYAELEDNEKTFTINTLKPGESKELVCKVVVKKDENTNMTTANISVSADTISSRQIQTISNEVKDSKLKIETKKSLSEEVQMYGNGLLNILTNVENLTDSEMKNIKGKIYLTNGLTFPEDYQLIALNEERENIEILKNIKYNKEENCIELEISTLEAKQAITIKTSLHIEALSLDELERNEVVYSEVESVVSNSAEINVKQIETTFSVVQTTNIKDGQKVKDDETIIITGEITNTGHIDTNISIEDSLPAGLEVVKVELIKNGETIDVTSKNQLQNIMVITPIKSKETVTVRIEVKVNTTRISTEEITNKIVVMGVTGKGNESNEIAIQIDSDVVNSETEEPEVKPGIENTDPEETKPTPEKPDEEKPGDEKPGDTKPGDDKDPEEKKFVISGYAWVDKNENNIKDKGEELKDITVKIIDIDHQNTFVKDSNGNQIEAKTDEKGLYEIKEIPKGNYNLIFSYDTSNYELKGSSDLKDYIIEDTKQKVAITNNIKLDTDKTVDLILIELTEFDLKIDKYITKVVIQTANGTKTTEYAKQQLVKEEISRKYLVGSTVLVEYTMEISNIGELAGYATEIIDYLPKDMKFYSELNTQWYVGEDGNIYNTTLASTIINPGETKTVKLILSKTMNRENTGTTSNIAEISESINSKEYNDIDKNNNQSKAEVIINIATGTVITYLVAILNSVLIVAIGMYMIKKKVVGKE